MPAKARQQFENGGCDKVEENLPRVPRFRGRTRIKWTFAQKMLKKTVSSWSVTHG